MNKFKIIDNYYPELSAGSTTEQRLLRSMLKLLEQKEYYEHMHFELQKTSGIKHELPNHSEEFEQLKINICNLVHWN